MNRDPLVAVVTGGTRGIGAATARALARQGATVIVVARDTSRGETFERELRREGAADARFVSADLSSLADAARTSQAIVSRHPRVDVLVNNAAGMFPKRTLTPEGVEKTFALDYLVPMLLCEVLRPALEAAPSGRIVNVVSKAAGRGRLDLDDLTFERGYSGLAAYARAKLALILGTIDYAGRHPKLHVNCVHPGMVNTGMPQELPAYFRVFVRAFGRFLATPEQGAERVLRLAVGTLGATITGAYVDVDRPARPPRASTDSALRARLREVTDGRIAEACASTSVHPGG